MLARKKQDQRKSASEEARKQAMWDERNRIRDEEEKAAASGVKPKSTQATLQDSIGVAVSESKWDRLMNGGGKKKKTKRAPAAAEAAAGQGADARGGGSERKKPGEDGASVRAPCAHHLSHDTCLPSRLPPPKPFARSRSKRPTGCEPPWAWHRSDSRPIGSTQLALRFAHTFIAAGKWPVRPEVMPVSSVVARA